MTAEQNRNAKAYSGFYTESSPEKDLFFKKIYERKQEQWDGWEENNYLNGLKFYHFLGYLPNGLPTPLGYLLLLILSSHY